MTNVDNLINQAKVLISKSKLKDAEIVFNEILKIEPTYYKAYINIGVICIKNDKLFEAEKNFKEALKIKPDFELAHYNLGTIQEKLGKIKEAEQSFKKAINLKPDYFEAYTNLGTLFLGVSKYNDAEKFLKKALLIKPNFTEAHYNLGLTQSLMNRDDLAEISYKKALEFNPRFKDAYNNLNKIYRERKLLFNIEQNKKLKKNDSNFIIGLSKNPYIFNRKVEDELISELYKIETEELDKTRDIRYGNGVCSDYELFKNNSSILKIAEKDLTKIMSEAIKSNIFIIESFFNILRTGSGLTIHNHLNEFDKKHNLTHKKYSLTYYLDVGDQKCSDPGILKLYDPIEEILPSSGTIVIFPASRKHSVVYRGKAERVMIGINFYSLD